MDLEILIIILAFLALYITLAQRFLTREHPKLFKRAVKRYTKADSTSKPEPGALICTGSSVMKFWQSCQQDLSPLPVYNRALAGTKINEITYWLDELVLKYKPGAILLYAGSNDMQGNKAKNAEQVNAAFVKLIEKCQEKIPALQIYFISILPAPSFLRWKHWPEIQKANRLIEEYCVSSENLHFIDISKAFLSDKDKPDKSLFKYDLIHLNSNGYDIWTAGIREVLMEKFAG